MSPSVTLITIGPHPGTLTTLLAFPGVQAILSLPVSSREFSVALKTHRCLRSKSECIGRCLQKKETSPPWGLLCCRLCVSSAGVRPPQPSGVTDGKTGSGTVQRGRIRIQSWAPRTPGPSAWSLVFSWSITYTRDGKEISSHLSVLIDLVTAWSAVVRRITRPHLCSVGESITIN